MGRTPEGDQAQTGAERQARYRQRLAMERPSAQPLSKRPSRARPLSRRWLDTVATLASLQAEYASWLEALPEATRETATGKLCRPWSIWTWRNSSPYSRPSALGAISVGR